MAKFIVYGRKVGIVCYARVYKPSDVARGYPSSRLAIFAGFFTASARFRLVRAGGRGGAWGGGGGGGGGSSSRLAGFDGVVPIDVAEVPTGLDDIAHAAFELLGLGETAVGLAVPQDARRKRLAARGGSGSGGGHDVDDKGAAGGRLECDLAQGGREGREELLRILTNGREQRGGEGGASAGLVLHDLIGGEGVGKKQKEK